MRTRVSMFRLYLHLGVFLFVLQLISAHDAKERSGELARVNWTSQWTAHGMGVAVAQGKKSGQATTQLSNKPETHLIDLNKNQKMGSRNGKPTNQTMASTEPKDGQRMAQMHPKINTEDAAVSLNDDQNMRSSMNRTRANSKNQGLEQQNKTMTNVGHEASSQSQNETLADTQHRVKTACKPQVKDDTNDQSMTRPKPWITSQSNGQDMNQSKAPSNMKQSQINDQGTGQSVGQEQVTTISGAQ